MFSSAEIHEQRRADINRLSWQTMQHVVEIIDFAQNKVYYATSVASAAHVSFGPYKHAALMDEAEAESQADLIRSLLASSEVQVHVVVGGRWESGQQ